MINKAAQRPFLSHFFETRRAERADELGTSTVTKTSREGGDADYAAPNRLAGAGLLLATKTFTEAREDADADEAPKRGVLRRTSLGTKTGTATREQGDADDARSVDALSAQLGTQTSTRARENGDADAAPSRDGFWTASLL
jgi:hypothetical protein